MTEISKHKNVLLDKAKEDFDAANDLIKMENFSEEIILFHCQQTVEKALKAYLSSKEKIYPKSHDLEVLLSQCIKEDKSFEEINFITALTPYAVEICYDEFIEVSQDEVNNILSQTKQALDFIISRIK